jgi:hypothetical protein
MSRTPVAGIKDRIAAAIATVSIEKLKGIWMELEYCLDVVCAKNGGHVECV